MKEAEYRKWHGRMGVLLAIFIILQAGSGLFISLAHLNLPHGYADTGYQDADQHNHEHSMNTEHRRAEAMPPDMHRQPRQRSVAEITGGLHYGGEFMGTLYRIILAIGLLGQAIGGTFIFFKTRQRSKRLR